jgi:hypothetical protein
MVAYLLDNGTDIRLSGERYGSAFAATAAAAATLAAQGDVRVL